VKQHAVVNRYVFSVSVVAMGGKRAPGRSSFRWEDNINVDLRDRIIGIGLQHGNEPNGFYKV
jgi:hypothetical protein